MTKRRIACLQIDIQFGNVKANLQAVANHFKQLDSEVDTVVLPEFWPMGYSLDSLDEIASYDVLTPIKTLAKQYNVDVIAGSVPTGREGKFYNSLPVITREGEVTFWYDKVHLFRLMDEEKFLVEGKDNGVFTLQGVKSAAVICYDIRFPEWIKTQMLEDVDVLYVVAEWPEQRLDHWRALLVARAIENQVYVVACNRVGCDPNNTFAGHSMVIDPWGQIISEADNQTGILTAAIDLAEVKRIRREIPIYEDRRPDLYRLKDE
ncbi:Predicted amidohydrolase [Halolactibacillus halophilus]|uniref:Hydrolase n=1 Tax=Halolactibacillus halophilus TaxID=306540 RepID=A0A1I5LZM5_9BACI|nr:carbon-nitrogen family hydrolase [Halolactibacillus halophilus]GEM00937.1 hydrolase [Halolactibacillus halophilus]SFP02216.1 Predicted amidohydrolase [Halolactibacillus halophilus]